MQDKVRNAAPNTQLDLRDVISVHGQDLNVFQSLLESTIKLSAGYSGVAALWLIDTRLLQTIANEWGHANTLPHQRSHCGSNYWGIYVNCSNYRLRVEMAPSYKGLLLQWVANQALISAHHIIKLEPHISSSTQASFLRHACSLSLALFKQLFHMPVGCCGMPKTPESTLNWIF